MQRRAAVAMVLVSAMFTVGCSWRDGGENDETVTDQGPALQATTSTPRGGGTDATSATSDSSTSTLASPGGDPVAEAAFCQAEDRNDREIRFAAGGSSAVIETAASAGQVDLFSIEVGDGQIMTITLTSDDDDAGFELLTLGEAPLDGPFTELVVEQTTAGPNWICVRSGSTGADHRLEVSVVDDRTPTRIDASWCGDAVNDRGEIRFATGESSIRIEQAVVRGERDLYTFDAVAGQPLDLFLPSVEDNAVLDLRAPSGELLITGVSDFRIPLPETGLYGICVGSTRGNAGYTLELAIG